MVPDPSLLQLLALKTFRLTNLERIRKMRECLPFNDTPIANVQLYLPYHAL